MIPHSVYPRLLASLLVVALVSGCGNDITSPTSAEGGSDIMFNASGNGFDDLGYNRTARIFNGPADGADGNIDGTYNGDPTYASDHLKMKWNAEWDRGNAEGWTDPAGYAAHIDNLWNGKGGGSGETWHYRIKWIGACGATGAPLPDGGYCIWGQFEVVTSHGTALNQHFWDAHANPAGFGN